MSDDTVRVAVRIRPLVSSEIEKGCEKCLSLVPGGHQQIQIRGTDKAFTFNHVFDESVDHNSFYEAAIKRMVNNVFEGYNVTILAYGQTGSGKTHSMGTNYDGDRTKGVIPLAVHDVFATMNSKPDDTFRVSVSFMELYKEQLYDLLADKQQRQERIVDIREDKGIKIVGLTEKQVNDATEALRCLTQGSLERATGATAMNSQSSRSHAIFTMIIHQTKNHDANSATTSKFHFVDLAGSERSKKTLATGERFKEGVTINKGLLALGNVISQLGEGNSATSYIGYRDSKLTRLLQDSLGGNSMTLMIACVSPADYNLDESLSTLRYADRARKIKNKPIINQDPKALEINRLNAVIQELRMTVINQRSTGSACPPEHSEIAEKNRMLQRKLRELTDQLNLNLIEIVNMHERAELAEAARENIKAAMGKFLRQFEEVLEKFEVGSDERNLVEPIYKKILELQYDQKRTAEEILQHELTSMSVNKSVDSNNLAEASGDEAEIEEFGDETRYNLDEKHAEHTLRQAERNCEIQSINQGLAIKEELISTLLKNSTQIAEHSKELLDMENEIKTLHAEKEELVAALQNHQSNSVSAKLAQTRRKKVLELEKKITELTKKCTEQMRVIKTKEKSDQQIKNLSNEIGTLKQTRVRLIREMRKETEKFNQWKKGSEREVGKLKKLDIKRQNEMVKLQSQHNKQQSVYKRKIEEASAIIKRLKEAHQRREKHLNSKEGGIQNWVQQELAVLVSTVDAECSLEKLMQDRALVTRELEELKKSDSESPELLARVTEHKEYLDLRNIQIADLQQKIMESDQENRANTRWNVIQSMTDAKAALKVLFETTANDRKNNFLKMQEMDELMEKYDATLMKNRQYELQKTGFSENVQMIKDLAEELETYKEKTERLEKQLLITEGPLAKDVSKKSAPRNRLLAETSCNSTFHMTDDSATDDDTENDPDWQRTPLLMRFKKHSNSGKNTSTESSASLKRSLEGTIRCSCKTTCATRLCSCVKNHLGCANCNCNVELCQNRDKENTDRNLFTDVTMTHKFHESEEPSKRARLDS